MSTSQLAPPGSSKYTSNTMFVGDGTWDTERNTFLLPNLVGLNFDTMRYNGMGNRFRELSQYHILIRGHAIVAAITFLFLVPSAILIIRFRTRDRWTVRVHIWLQILTVLLATVVFSLGWLAVGPKRSLSNPHHGIGLAIYVLVLAQAFGGWWIHSREVKKGRFYEPLKAMIHHWFGRMISLLGLAQIPLGLALYGSPLALFVLYTLAVFALLLIYFILSYTRDRRGGNEYGSRYSYGSESLSEGRGRRSSGVEGVVKAGIIGAGLAKLVGGFRNRSRSRGDHPEVVGSRTGSRRGSRRHSGSYVEEEKYSEYEQDSRRDSRRDGEGWKDKLLKIGFIAGTLGAIKYLFERRNHRDRDSDTEDYGPPLGGATAINPENMNDRLEEGRPLPSGQHPLNHQRSTSSLSYSSFMSASREGRRGHGLRDAVAGIGAFGIGRNFFKNRRDKKEQRRLETQRQRELENERRARANNQRHTGDGYPRRSDRRGSWTTSTDISTSTDTPRYDAGIPPPIPAGVFPTAAASAAALSRQRDQQQGNLHPSNTAIPPTGPVSMPQIPQDPQGIFHRESSGSEAYVSAGGRQHRRRSGRGGAAAAAVAAGVAAGEASSSRHDRRQSGSNDNVTTPPVSVKVKVHSDGRHVTLRRLPEEEAAEERRRRSRHGRRRKGSASSLGDTNAGGDRWRRAGNIEQQQADAMRVESQNLAAARSQPEIQPQVQLQIPPQAPPHAQPQIPPQNLPVPLPPPPPIPGSSVGHRPGTTGSVGSPGHDISGTEASADYANNRRRRRAERAQAKQAREARSGPDVEFT